MSLPLPLPSPLVLMSTSIFVSALGEDRDGEGKGIEARFRLLGRGLVLHSVMVSEPFHPSRLRFWLRLELGR